LSLKLFFFIPFFGAPSQYVTLFNNWHLLLNPNGALSAFAQSFFNHKCLPSIFFVIGVRITYFCFGHWKEEEKTFDLGIDGW